MTTINYASGEIIIEEGTRPAFVGYVIEGAAEVLKAHGSNRVLLGRIGRGEYVGEMAVIENGLHGASVRAIEPVLLEQIPPEAFVGKLAENQEVAWKLLVRLIARLRALNQTYTEAAGDLIVTESGQALTVEPEPVSARAKARLLPGSPQTEAMFAHHAPIDMSLPFVVGRTLDEDELPSDEDVTLQLDDTRPYRLSRAHFAVIRTGERLWVQDLGSFLGTIVNGVPIGSNFGADTAVLIEAENIVVAGGMESPFVFRIIVES